jgi:phosphatidate cytidylyltransferase
MTPAAALDSPIFLRYLIIIGAFLAATGLILLLLRFALRRDVRAPTVIWSSWLLMAAAVLLCLFAGRAATIAGFTLLSLIACKEFARATGLYRDWLLTSGIYLGIVAAGVLCFLRDPTLDHPGWYGLYMALPVYVIGALLLIPILRNRVAGQLQALALSIVGFIYLGWMFLHVAFLANANHAYGYLLYLLLAVAVNDVAAYTFGKLLGRHKLRSNISPNKTWEGFLGALAVSMVLPWLVQFSFPHFTMRDLILAGLIVGFGGTLGDLSISVIKRDLGIKDMGALIHGHGGLLDRIDSLIYTAPLFLHMVRWFHELH